MKKARVVADKKEKIRSFLIPELYWVGGWVVWGGGEKFRPMENGKKRTFPEMSKGCKTVNIIRNPKEGI